MLPPTFVEGFHDSTALGRMPYRQVGKTGMIVSAIGFGASSLGGCFGDVDRTAAIEAVHVALKAGVNYIDTAPWYNNSEEVLGEALSSVPREAYYIATKVGRYPGPVEKRFDFSASRVEESVKESLRRLRVPFVDVLQVHDIEFAPELDVIINETLPAMRRMKELGFTKHIGITGYPLSALEEVVRRSPVPLDTCLSYCRHTLAEASLQVSLLPLLTERGVGVINAGAVAMGLLAAKGPPAWHPAGEETKAAAAAARSLCASAPGDVDIARLAVRHSAMSDERVHVTLVGTAVAAEALKNVGAVSEPATAEEEAVRAELQALLRKRLGPSGGAWEGVEVAEYRRELANVARAS